MNDYKLHTELLHLSRDIYHPERGVPDNWKIVSEASNSNNGFYAQTYEKDGKIVIVFKGTDITLKGNETQKDLYTDLQMATRNIPNQLEDAEKYYYNIKNQFKGKEVILCGHSLGGSLSAAVGYKTGAKAVTFNAYGINGVIDKEYRRANNVINYGNSADPFFRVSLDYQIGTTYILKEGLEPNGYPVTRGWGVEKTDPAAHKLENMPDLKNAIKYTREKNYTHSPSILRGHVEEAVNYKDVDPKRIILADDINKLPKEQFEANKELYEHMLNNGQILQKKQLERGLKSGSIIWVNDYYRHDGVHVSGYFRHL